MLFFWNPMNKFNVVLLKSECQISLSENLETNCCSLWTSFLSVFSLRWTLTKSLRRSAQYHRSSFDTIRIWKRAMRYMTPSTIWYTYWRTRNHASGAQFIYFSYLKTWFFFQERSIHPHILQPNITALPPTQTCLICCVVYWPHTGHNLSIWAFIWVSYYHLALDFLPNKALTQTHCIVLVSPFVPLWSGTLVNTGPP